MISAITTQRGKGRRPKRATARNKMVRSRWSLSFVRIQRSLRLVVQKMSMGMSSVRRRAMILPLLVMVPLLRKSDV